MTKGQLSGVPWTTLGCRSLSRLPFRQPHTHLH